MNNLLLMMQPDFKFPGNGNGNCNGVGNPFDCEPSAPIDDYILILFFGGLFIILLYDFIKRKNK